MNFYLDEPAIVPAMIEAGATWCIGLTPTWVEEHLAAIRSGPPQIEAKQPDA